MATKAQIRRLEAELEALRDEYVDDPTLDERAAELEVQICELRARAGLEPCGDLEAARAKLAAARGRS